MPSMIDKIKLQRGKPKKLRLRLKRWTVGFTRFYRYMVLGLCRFRVFVCLLLLLAFGLPVFLIPEKIENAEQKGNWAEWYNDVFDNSTYKENIKPIIDKALGGTLRLFVEKVYNGSYFGRGEEEVVLSVNATLPNGSTLEQMNVLVKKMETYLSEFKEIKQFQTSIYDARHAYMQIFFKKSFSIVVFLMC